jgi:hypothetical protein
LSHAVNVRNSSPRSSGIRDGRLIKEYDVLATGFVSAIHISETGCFPNMILNQCLKMATIRKSSFVFQEMKWGLNAAWYLKFFYQQVEYILDPTCIGSSFLGAGYNSIVFAGEPGN